MSSNILIQREITNRNSLTDTKITIHRQPTLHIKQSDFPLASAELSPKLDFRRNYRFSPNLIIMTNVTLAGSGLTIRYGALRSLERNSITGINNFQIVMRPVEE